MADFGAEFWATSALYVLIVGFAELKFPNWPQERTLNSTAMATSWAAVALVAMAVGNAADGKSFAGKVVQIPHIVCIVITIP